MKEVLRTIEGKPATCPICRQVLWYDTGCSNPGFDTFKPCPHLLTLFSHLEGDFIHDPLGLDKACLALNSAIERIDNGRYSRDVSVYLHELFKWQPGVYEVHFRGSYLGGDQYERYDAFFVPSFTSSTNVKRLVVR